MCGRLVGSVLVAAVLGPPAAADVVYLTNGRTLEGVVAEVDAERVRIRLEFGEIALARQLVARVESGGSPLAEFEARRMELATRPAGAADWLELARWARGAGLDHAAAQAALRAVELDPDVAGAAPLLTALGLVRDEESGEWLRYEEAMSRRGLVSYRGGWVTGEEASALRGAEARAVEAEAAAERDERLTRAIELLALAQLAEATAPPAPVGVPIYGYPVWWGGGFLPFQPPVRPRPTPHQPGVLHDLLHRNPGSLLPVGDPGQVLHDRFIEPVAMPPAGRQP